MSRQREFLADASSAQFTRNPAGLAGALRRIARHAAAGSLRSVHAREASHLFFADSVLRRFTNLFATHPPLEERIRRIDPSGLREDVQSAPSVARPDSAPARPSPAAMRVEAASARMRIHPEAIVASVGEPQCEHVAHAAALLQAVPESLVAAARDPFGARALIYALLLSRDPVIRAEQEKILTDRTDAPTLQEVARRRPEIEHLPAALRIPVVDLATGGLRHLSSVQYRAFQDVVEALIQADRHVDLFEYMLRGRMARHLEPMFSGKARAAVCHASIRSILPACRNLLACLAYWGADDPDAVRVAYETAYAYLQAGPPLPLPSAEQGDLASIDRALRVLAKATPGVKRRLLQGAIACVGADGWTTVEEAELLRIVADALDLPLPPILSSGT